ncbi:the Emap Ii-like cytokine, partial [Thamnocephalis sphaerospora]
APAGPVISQIDLRVGRIVECQRHENAEALYVERIDVGEEEPRTVISGLVRFVPLEAMQNRDVIVMCNLKPVNMRGIKSCGMVMCASSEDGTVVEPLAPPTGARPGDRVYFDGFRDGQPDAQLNPKKKIFEAFKPGMKTTATGEAAWTSPEGKVHLMHAGDHGVVVSKTVNQGQIS